MRLRVIYILISVLILMPNTLSSAESQHQGQKPGETNPQQKQESIKNKDNISFLKERLANNKKLSNSQKDELVNFFENQYQEKVAVLDSKRSIESAYFEMIANDPELTQKQKKDAIKNHFENESERIKKELLEKEKAENKGQDYQGSPAVTSNIGAENAK